MFRRKSAIWLLVYALVLICSFSSLAQAQCPARTTIADTIYNADGTPADGRIVISWPTFLVGSCQVVAGQTSVTLAAGALSVQLYPNDTAIPFGTSYRASYYLKSGKVTTEYWVVPTVATPVLLAVIHSATVPVPAVAVSEGQVTNLVADLAKKVELPSPCPAGKILQSNGAVTQPQVTCVSGGGGSQHQVNAANLAANDPVNFQDTATVGFSNPSAGNVQATVKDGAITAAKLAASSPSVAQLSGLSDNNISANSLSANRISGTAVVQSRAVNTSAPLSGGGSLATDLALGCSTCEVTANRGAAFGYAALDGAAKVVQDPASAQSTPSASKIPLADASGKISDGWLSANVSLLGQSIDLTAEVSGILPGASGGTGNGFFSWPARPRPSRPSRFQMLRRPC